MLCLHGMLWTYPTSVYLGLSHFSPKNRPQILILSTFLTYWVFLHIYCQPLFDFNKDLLTKYNKLHAHISGDAMMENMSFCLCCLDIQEQIFIFSISFLLHIFKQNRKVISSCYFFEYLLDYEFTWPFLQ